MTRASVLLGAGSLAMATGLMGAAAPAIELAVEGGVYRVFTQGVDRPQALRVRIENQANRPLAGIVAVTLLAGGPQCSAPFAAPAGGLVDVDVPWPGAATAPTNQYGVTVSATTPAGTVSRHRQPAAGPDPDAHHQPVRPLRRRRQARTDDKGMTYSLR